MCTLLFPVDSNMFKWVVISCISPSQAQSIRSTRLQLNYFTAKAYAQNSSQLKLDTWLELDEGQKETRGLCHPF